MSKCSRLSVRVQIFVQRINIKTIKKDVKKKMYSVGMFHVLSDVLSTCENFVTGTRSGRKY